MTNADCIRRMSDEQLYEFLSEWECGDIDYSVTFCDLCNEATKRGEIGNILNLDCDGCRKHWLQRDAVDYGGLMYWKRNTVFDTADRKTEPQINADQHAQRVKSVETMSCQECRRWIYDDRWGWFCPLKSQDECKYEPKDGQSGKE